MNDEPRRKYAYHVGMFILKANNLVKRYGDRTVVDHVTFDVSEGEIVGLLGRNGAGKTTSFRSVIGMITPEEGQVIFNGQDVTDLPMFQRARLGMGYLSQEPSIFQRLSVYENLMAILETRPIPRSDRNLKADELLRQFDLEKNRKQYARSLSGGERRRLEIARAICCQPTLILLDEPFAGVDPRGVEDLQDELLELRDRMGIAMLVTDHNVHHILSVCDRVYIIDQGKVIAEGTPKQIINNDLVRKSYLGSSFRGDEFDDDEDDEDQSPAVAAAGS